jgi:LysM repeat protein
MMAEDFRLDRDLAETVTGTRSKRSMSLTSFLISLGIVVLILALGFALFFKFHKGSTGDLKSIKNRLTMLEQSHPRLAGQMMELEQSVSKLNATGESLTQRMDELSYRVAQLQSVAVSEQAKSEAPVRVQEKSAVKTRTVYHQVQAGETLYRIAKKYGISVAEVCRLNQISTGQAIKPGQKLLVSKEGAD